MAAQPCTRRWRKMIVALSLVLPGLSSAGGCSSGCGLGLAQVISFSSRPVTPGAPSQPIPCCGESAFQDVILTGKDIEQVDLANSSPGAGHVDAFLTDPDCTRLFAASYNGSASQPLCKVYVGPVSSGTVSQKQTIPKGVYRVFAQAWASNEQSSEYQIDVGIWSTRCGTPVTGPTPVR